MMELSELWAVLCAARRVAESCRARYEENEANGIGGDVGAAAQSELADADAVEGALQRLYEAEADKT